ncbi:MAG: hypothetical protein QOJ01_1965 [Solirubrobacterales bacterium]|jgi:hypothetical protein|nr:hypothetical protein [Solirubrobacterales bacterium]
MCIQCMATAMSSVGAASGTRAWLGSKFGARIGPVAMRRVTVGLFAAAVLASGVGLSGSTHSVPAHAAIHGAAR